MNPATRVVVWCLLILSLLWRGPEAVAGEAAQALQAKLAALEAARGAGVLTDQEYATKKRELEAQLRAATSAVDEATRRQLEALETARRAGILTDEEYARKKAELTREPQQAPQGREGAVAPSAPATAGGVTYRHPLGLSFVHPKDWRVQPNDQGFLLIPPDVTSNQLGPTELYFATGRDAAGIERPDDPRVAQFFEGQVAALFPFLRRVGQAERLQAGGRPGALLTWEGTSPANLRVRALVFTAIVKGYGLSLVALGEPQRIAARRAQLDAIFASLRLDEGQKDPRLVGMWRSESHYSSRDFSSTSVRTMALRPDGSLISDSRLLASGSQRDSGGNLSGSATVDTGEDPGTRGRWAAADGQLYMVWGDGSSARYGYHVEGNAGSRNMLLTPANGKKELWTQVR